MSQWNYKVHVIKDQSFWSNATWGPQSLIHFLSWLFIQAGTQPPPLSLAVFVKDYSNFAQMPLAQDMQLQT